jgi:hypothetical protein
VGKKGKGAGYMAKLKRAEWKIKAEWVGEEIRGVVTKGDIDEYKFLTIPAWIEQKEKAAKKWQKSNPNYKLLKIELNGIKTIDSY